MRQQPGVGIKEHEHQVTQHADGEVETSSPPKKYYSLAQTSWVELPFCKGVPGETPLTEDLLNATVADCRIDPSTNYKELQNKYAANKARESVTPKKE